MLTKRTSLIIGACLLLSILLCFLFCVFGYIGLRIIGPKTVRYPQEAKRSVNITIDTSQREEFFSQLRKFADKHDFTILIDTGANPSGKEFYIEMYRDDIEISGLNVWTPEEYNFAFYHSDLLHPAPDSAFDDLINDLEKFINEVPGTTFSVEK